MKTYKRLLVPIDFSDASVAALSTALDLAHSLGAEIRTIHVHQLQVPYVGDGGFYVPEMGDSDINIMQEVRLGDPETEINEIADEYQVDMIVMGTHGRSGLSHLLMGSVTESVLRHTNVPVLVIRQK